MSSTVLVKLPNGDKKFNLNATDISNIPLTVFRELYKDGYIDNSFDQADLHRGDELGVDYVLEVGQEKVKRVKGRKKTLFEKIDERDDILARLQKLEEKALETTSIQFETASIQLQKAEQNVHKLKIVMLSQTISNIVQALNDIMYDLSPDTNSTTAWGREVLTFAEVGYLRQNKITYITRLMKWAPSDSSDIGLKKKALNCLTTLQQDILLAFTSPDIYNLGREERNGHQHPIPSVDTALHLISENVPLLGFQLSEDLKEFLHTFPMTLNGKQLFLGVEDELQTAVIEEGRWETQVRRLRLSGE